MPPTTALKKLTNLSIDFALLAEAKDLNINLSKAAESGLRQEVARVKTGMWKKENASAIESSNRWVRARGLPLHQFRLF